MHLTNGRRQASRVEDNDPISSRAYSSNSRARWAAVWAASTRAARAVADGSTLASGNIAQGVQNVVGMASDHDLFAWREKRVQPFPGVTHKGVPQAAASNRRTDGA
jgi:hypothetical protein